MCPTLPAKLAVSLTSRPGNRPARQPHLVHSALDLHTMTLPHATVRSLRRMIAAATLCIAPLAVSAQAGDVSNQPPANPQYQQRAQRGPQNQPAQRGRGGFGQPQGPHLPQWFQQRSNLTPEQRQQELRREPGFRQMSPDAQQRALQGLQKLNSMTPEQRQRALARNEAMEHLSPAQRQQFRGAMDSWKTLPPDRKLAVARSFRELRALPPSQRSAALNSPQYRSRLSDDERRNLDMILSVEPAMPGQTPAAPPGYPYGHP